MKSKLPYLTPYQVKVLEMRKSMTPMEIAVALGTSRNNVYYVLDRAKDKLTEAAYRAIQCHGRPFGLTERELQVMIYKAQGYSNPEAAAEMCTTLGAFAETVNRAVVKLGCVNVHQACFKLGQDARFVQLTTASS